jgi:pimeloyl-ACP methyl ester carboxylesterase
MACTPYKARRVVPPLAPLALALLAAAGCAPSAEELLRPDASRGALAEDGPFGALHERTTLRLRVDQTVATDLYVPTDGDGVAEGPFPLVLLHQGGLVAADRYSGLAAHIASRGFVVVSPSHTGQIAFFDAGTGLDALFAARRASDTGAGVLAGRIADVPGLAIGHSLGGVVAAKTWLAAPDELSHLVLLASYPDGGDDLSVRTRGTVVSLIGSEDGRADVNDVVDGARRFQTETVAATIDGMNHMQVVDAPTPQELQNDGEATIPDALARTRVQFLIDAALDELVGRRGVLDDPNRWPLGVDPIDLGDSVAAANDGEEGGA